MFKLFCLILLPLQLAATTLSMNDAKAGDYIVYAYKESLVLVRVREHTDSHLVFEEINAPKSAASNNWQEWVSKKAPGHTSWTISRIDLTLKKVDSIFSVDERMFLNTNPAFQFLPTLLKVDIEPIADSERKRVGIEPQAGEPDYRRLWLPKITYEGNVITPPVAAYKTKWPDDESDLSSKTIDIYLPQREALTYLPYWIEVSGGWQKAKISALDSGRGLTSPILLNTYEQDAQQ